MISRNYSEKNQLYNIFSRFHQYFHQCSWTTLQRVMSAAARVIGDTRKFDHGLTQILHDDLHWLDGADRVTYKLGVIMYRRV